VGEKRESDANKSRDPSGGASIDPKEGLRLISAFTMIVDREVRQKLIEFVEALAKAPRSGPRH